MYDLIKEAVNDMNAAWELSYSDKDVVEIVDAVSELEIEEAMSLGMNFKKFPLGCDLNEVLVGTCASDLEKIDLIGNCMLADSIGASIHVCAYAFADIAEVNGMKGIDLIREVRESIDVPIDLDHFGRYGPMRFPKEIVKCHGQCYMEGPPFDGCPKDRIHSRLLDKEKDALADKEEWVKLSSTVAINLTAEQSGENHAAPYEEAEDVANLAKKYGKGLEAIMFVGDGYDDLINAFNAAIKIGADAFVLEGGPFNRSDNRLESFAKAVTMARILCPGKIVATNGAYEDECRVGLRSGLNTIITGFPQNHHGYMCGYKPKEARRGKFGLPRIIKIIKEEIPQANLNVPIEKNDLEAIARAVKIVSKDNIYPNKIGKTFLGDAHWAGVAETPLYDNCEVNLTAKDLNDIGDSVSLLGGRFISWAIAKELDGTVDEIIISDKDPWVEKVTVDNLSSELKSTVFSAKSDDDYAYDKSDSTIISSTIPSLVNILSKKYSDSISLI